MDRSSACGTPSATRLVLWTAITPGDSYTPYNATDPKLPFHRQSRYNVQHLTLNSNTNILSASTPLPHINNLYIISARCMLTIFQLFAVRSEASVLRYVCAQRVPSAVIIFYFTQSLTLLLNLLLLTLSLNSPFHPQPTEC